MKKLITKIKKFYRCELRTFKNEAIIVIMAVLFTIIFQNT